MRKLRSFVGAFITGLGLGVIGVALGGMLTLGANIFLPRGWVARAVGQELQPPTPPADLHDPVVRVEQGERPPLDAPPTPDFRLDASVPRLYYLWIPRLGLYAPVVSSGQRAVQVGDQPAWQLDAPPAFAVGWSNASAPVGAAGNTVFVGHNNVYGDVFKDLWYLSAGDEIVVQTDQGDRRYLVSEVAQFEEKNRSLQERLANAQWIAPTPDERLTLVTCWPYYTNSHRLVVVARPAS